MKIGIIGSGNVGSAAAYSIILQGIAKEVVLVDYNKEMAIAQASDILHATSMYEYNHIYAGDYADLENADIVVITAGSGRKPEQTRTDLLKINVSIIKTIAENISKYAPDSIIIVASNPADAMAHISLEVSKFAKNKVIGTGTSLDSSRFRAELAKHLELPAKSIDANVFGEHGDSQVLIWSNANVSGQHIFEYAKKHNKEFSEDLILQINENVIKGGQNIIKGKGSTFYGIGACIARICKAIKNDENCVLMVSSLQKNVEGIENIFISLPTIIGKNGIKEVITQNIDKTEQELLKNSAKAVEENTKIALDSLS